MGKFDGVLLASDFDGTLCAKDGEIPEANLRALEYFRAEGGRFTAATGRTPVTFGGYAETLGVNAPAVLFNGSALYDFQTGEALEHLTLPPTAADDLAALCRAVPELGLEAYCWEKLFVFRPNWVTDFHMDMVGNRITYTVCPDVASLPRPWTKVIVQQDHGTLLRARDWLEAHCPGRYEIFFSHDYYLELVARGVSKGGMVTRLAGRLGLRMEDVYCVGDGENDLSMLAVSAIPFAPDNCSDVVRRSGARIVRPCDQGAVAHVVEILDARY